MAEWLCSGLQIRERRFDSDLSLQIVMENKNFIDLSKTFSLVKEKMSLFSFVSSLVFLVLCSYYFLQSSYFESESISKVITQTKSDQTDSAESIISSFIGIDGKNNDSILARNILTSKTFFLFLISNKNILNNLVNQEKSDSIPEVFNADLVEFSEFTTFDENLELGYLNYSSNVQFIFKDGFVTIIVTHKSPIFARDFNNLIINKLNFYQRDKDTKNSEEAIKFLEKKYESTKNKEVQRSISSLIQNQLKFLSISQTKNDYFLEVIEKPYKPSNSTKASFFVFILISLIISLILSFFFILLRYFKFLISEE